MGGSLVSNYILRDEVFDEVKRFGFFGIFIKVQKYCVVVDIFDLDKEFWDFDEVREMYMLVGEELNFEIMVVYQVKLFEFFW